MISINHVSIISSSSKKTPAASMPDNFTVFQSQDGASQYASNNYFQDLNSNQTLIYKPAVHDILKDDAEQPKKISISTIIKERFILKSLLGVGGMGKVYKALDIRKQEARDKDPYVAIKVLNDDFKNHPQAFIALQREARKSQQLSHPNIVNVYDFDRDNDLVFMTMELLQGRSLDAIIADDFPYGMPHKDAIKIIKAVSDALIYAHKHGIVHSDLKPSNIFITKDNVAKVFDFGIARACSLNDNQCDNDMTLFDPTQLGALTPTYASLQMINGHSPEPNDDLYSVACVCYELLSGCHPYKRIPADEASKLNLKPNKIKQLDLWKNRTLAKALKFKKNERHNDIESFIKTFETYKPFRLISILLLLVIILCVIAYSPQIIQQYHRHQQTIVVEAINREDSQLGFGSIEQVNDYLAHININEQTRLLKSIKETYLSLLQKRIHSLFDVKKQNFDYEEAMKTITHARQFYPDSAQIQRMQEALEQKRNQQLGLLFEQFNELLEISQLSHFDEPEQILEILSVLSKVMQLDPNLAVVSRKRASTMVKKSILQQIDNQNLSQAKKLLMLSQNGFHDDEEFKKLSEKLASLNDDTDLVNSYDINQDSFNSVSELQHELEQLVNDSRMDSQWEYHVNTIYLKLRNKLSPKSPWLNEKSHAIAKIYLKHAITMRENNKLFQARRYLSDAKNYQKSLFGIRDEQVILDAMEQMNIVKQKARQHRASIEALKITLETQIKALRMNNALRTFQKLKRFLGRNDNYIINNAKPNLTDGYYKQAKYYLKEKKFSLSLKAIEHGLSYQRFHPGLRKLQVEVKKKLSFIDRVDS